MLPFPKNPAKRSGLRLSIKTVVFGALGALALLAAGKYGWEALQSWGVYSRALEQREFSAATDKFIKGTYAILLERLATDNALLAPAAADGPVTAKIEGFRKSVKEFYEPGLSLIEQYSFPNKATLLDDLKANIRRADDVRRRADVSIEMPREQRDESLRQSFAPTMTDMINASLRLWYAAVYSTAKGDSELARLAVIKELGWKMREFSGLARAALSGSIASGAAVAPDRLAVISDNRARVNALWLVLQNLAKDPQTHPAILDAMRQAEDQYFKKFLSLAEEMQKAGHPASIR